MGEVNDACNLDPDNCLLSRSSQGLFYSVVLECNGIQNCTKYTLVVSISLNLDLTVAAQRQHLLAAELDCINACI